MYRANSIRLALRRTGTARLRRLAAAVVAAAVAAGLTSWYLAGWNTYDGGSFSFSYPRTWEAVRFGGGELTVAPIFPTHPNQGIAVGSAASPVADTGSACVRCAASVTTSGVTLGGRPAEMRVTHRNPGSVGELPDGNEMVEITLDSPPGRPGCGDVRIGYAAGYPNTGVQSDIITRIIGSFACR